MGFYVFFLNISPEIYKTLGISTSLSPLSSFCCLVNMDDLTILSEGIKLSQDLALNGEYQNAIMSFSSHLKLIDKMTPRADGSLQTDLMKARTNIEAEMKLINEILEELSLLSKPIQPTSLVTNEVGGDPDVWLPPTPKYDNPRQKAGERHSEVPSWARETKSSGGRGSGERRREGSERRSSSQRDEREQRDSRAKKEQGGRRRHGGGGGGSKREGKKREEEGRRKKKGRRRGEEEEEEEKPRYSEVAREEGWADLELITAIESEIVDRGVSVPWDNIAGLTTAKHLLQEAVVLPLWMPDYFK